MTKEMPFIPASSPAYDIQLSMLSHIYLAGHPFPFVWVTKWGEWSFGVRLMSQSGMIAVDFGRN